MTRISSLLRSLPFPQGQRLVLVDVGARWGANSPWNQLDSRYVTYIGFEPDAKECAELRARAGPNVEYVPIGLSDAEESHLLHITREPGCSSIFPPNHAAMSRYFLSERWDVRERVPIRTVPLARVLDERRTSPDALKIDVQGAALKVLKGAGRYLEDALLIDVEVEFREMYRGEALFAEVDAFVRGHGFELIDLNKYHARRRSLDSAHVSRGQVLFADVLYVKSIDAFYALQRSAAERSRSLWNLLIMLSLYGQFDLALDFVLHEKSTLTDEEKAAITAAIRAHTAIPRWKLLLFDHGIVEKAGLALSLLANSVQLKSRRFGWGSDQSAVDSRYKYYLSHPLLRIFRK